MLWKPGGDLEKEKSGFITAYRKSKPSDMHPAIMVRITDVRSLLEVIGLNENAPGDKFQAVLSIKDPIISENEGCWLWKLGKNGSTLERMKGLGLQTEADEAEQIPSSSEVLEINIDELAQWIFGYKTLGRDIRCDATVLDRICEDAARGIFGRGCVGGNAYG